MEEPFLLRESMRSITLYTLIGFLSLVLFLTYISGGAHAEPFQGWQGPQLISAEGTGIQQLDLATNSHGNSVAAWVERGQDGIGHVFVSNYDTKAGWTVPQTIENSTDLDADQPIVGIDDQDRALVTWGLWNFNHNGRGIWYSTYTEESGWGPATFLVGGLEADLALSSNGDGIFVYCQDWQVWAMNFNPAHGFGTAFSVDGSPGTVSNDPHIMLNSSGGALLVWTEQTYPTTPEHIYFSTDYHGAGWTPPELLTPYDAYDPMVAFNDNQGAAVVWTTTWYTHQLRVMLMNNGVWSDYVLLFERPEYSIYSHQVAMDDNGDAMAAWEVQNGSQMEIWWSYYPSGDSWSLPQRLNDSYLVHHQEGQYSGEKNAVMPKLVMHSDGSVTMLWYLQELDHYHLLTDRYRKDQGWRGVELVGEADNAPHELQVNGASSGNVTAAWESFNLLFSNRYVGLAGAPGAPRELRAVSSAGQVSLSWKAPYDDGGMPISGYRLHRNDGNYESIIDLDFSIHNYIDNGLENGRQYNYQIGALNANGEGALSFPAVGSPSSELPGPPRNFTASLEVVDVTLTWDQPLDSGDSPIIGYRIYRAQDDSQLQVLFETDAFTYLDSALTEGANYTYQVCAYSNAGEGERTGPIVVEVPVGAKLMPTKVKAEGQPLSIYISWDPPVSYIRWGLVGFKVYRGLAPDNVFYIASTASDIIQYSDSAISAGVVYYYRVLAIFGDPYGTTDGPLSNAVCNTTTQAFINVTSPQLFESWGQGTRHDITWVSGTGAVGPVDIALVWDAPYNVLTSIAIGEENDGSYIWDIPRDQQDGLYIKVSLTSDPSIFGISQMFMIGPYFYAPLNTTSVPIGPAGSGGWFVGDVQVILNASGFREGVYAFETWYCLDESPWVQYEEGSPFLIIGEGVHSLQYYSMDTVRHVEPMRNTTIPIEMSPPEVNLLNPSIPGARFNTSSIMVEWSDSDSLSGIVRREVRVDGGAWESSGGATHIDLIISEGYHQIEVNVTNGAGLHSTMTTSLTVDLTLPTVISASPHGKGIAIVSTPEVLFSEPMNSTSVLVHGITATQEWSGQKLTIRPVSSLQYSTKYTLVVEGKDLAGNELSSDIYSWSFTTLINFTGTVKDTKGEPLAGAGVRISDSVSVIATLTTSATGGFQTYLVDGNYTVQVNAAGHLNRTQQVALAPGQDNELQVQLDVVPSSEMPWLYIGIGVVAVLAGFGAAQLIMMRRKK